MTNRKGSFRAFVFCLAVVCLLVGCVTTPMTQRKALMLVSLDQEMALGLQAYREILSQSKLSDNPDWNRLVRKVGDRIARVSDMPRLPWEFKVIVSDEKNAFCLPGGKVAVYTGILPLAQTEAGLAAILGHEVAHAVARHAGERMSQALLVNLGLTVADLSLQNNQHRGLILAAMGLGASVGVLLPYSRLHEAEADEIGTLYMAKAGYDPREAVLLWQRFAKEGGARPPAFLSTHPAPERRVEELQKIVERAWKEYEKAPEKLGGGETIPLS